MDPNQIISMTVDAYNSLPQSTQEDMLNPAAKTLGKALDGAVTVVCSPLLMLGTVSKALLHKFSTEINQKINGIPQDNRDVSKLGLVIKAMEEARYQLNEDDIRQMYVNLISSTVDNRKNNMVNPRLATVVSQLGVSEASLLELLFKADNHTILTSELWGAGKTGDFKNSPTVLYTNNSFFKNYDSSIDILKSLGVINFPYKRRLTGHEKDYSLINNYLSTLTPNYQLQENDHSEFREGYIEYTNIGKDLYRCIFE